jgi:hypothetical protein
VSQGAWQNFEDVKYVKYLDRYYKRQLNIAYNVADKVDNDSFLTVAMAVFNKIASPSVYLQPHFKAWLEKQDKDAIPEPQPTPKTDIRWKPTNKDPKGKEWCSEKDATEEEMIRALDPNDRDMWYMKPREGYQYGAIFRKVKP